VNLPTKVDVVMPTFNSNHQLFRIVLESIASEVPVCHFIAVDKFSTDGTIEQVKRVFQNAICLTSGAQLAYARVQGIRTVDTSYFLAIDSDIILHEGYFKEIQSCFRLDNVGGVGEFTGWRVLRNPLNGVYETKELSFAAVVVKTEAVRDWNPDEGIASAECTLLSEHIRQKGYRLILTTHAPTTAVQNTTPRADFRKGLWWGAGAHQAGISASEFFPQVLGHFAASIFSSKYRRSSGPFCHLRVAAMPWGWLFWREYVDWKRPHNRPVSHGGLSARRAFSNA